MLNAAVDCVQFHRKLLERRSLQTTTTSIPTQKKLANNALCIFIVIHHNGSIESTNNNAIHNSNNTISNDKYREITEMYYQYILAIRHTGYHHHCTDTLEWRGLLGYKTVLCYKLSDRTVRSTFYTDTVVNIRMGHTLCHLLCWQLAAVFFPVFVKCT